MLARSLLRFSRRCDLSHIWRGIATSSHCAQSLPPRPQLQDTDITENFVKGTGPGGQKINKTSSACQIIHHPTGIVVKCQETRSRSQNQKLARRKLAEKLELLEKGDESRIAKKIEKAHKKKASKTKKSRRKYKKLAGEKADTDGSKHDEGEEDDSLTDSSQPAQSMSPSETTSVSKSSPG